MSERSGKKLEAYEIDYICDICLIGKMRPTGAINGTGFVHKCPKCTHTTGLNEKYPKVGFRHVRPERPMPSFGTKY